MRHRCYSCYSVTVQNWGCTFVMFRIIIAIQTRFHSRTHEGQFFIAPFGVKPQQIDKFTFKKRVVFDNNPLKSRAYYSVFTRICSNSHIQKCENTHNQAHQATKFPFSHLSKINTNEPLRFSSNSRYLERIEHFD